MLTKNVIIVMIIISTKIASIHELMPVGFDVIEVRCKQIQYYDWLIGANNETLHNLVGIKLHNQPVKITHR